MAERYTRLYSLPADLYTPGAPLVIAAGALLKDNQTGRVLAQLKMRSISDRVITAVKVLVVGYDVARAEICREEHQYLDMKVARDRMFGSKEAVLLRDSAVRSFTAQVTAVYFDDGDSYDGTAAVWEPLPEQKELLNRLFDAELIRQYRLETTERSRFVPLETEDLWLCTCGEINHNGESCFRCGQALDDVKALLDVELLRENKSLRLKAEAEQARREEQRRQSRSYKLRRLALIVIPLLLIAAIAAGAYYLSARRQSAYNAAVALYDAGSYSEAAAAFDKLGSYRDSADYLSRSRTADALASDYTRAGKLLENGRYDDARELYLSLGDYQDAQSMALEARYRQGLELLESGEAAEARDIFTELGAYRDAADYAAHFFDRLLTEEISFQDDCQGPLTTVYTYDEQGRIATKTELFSAYEKMTDRVSAYVYQDDGSYSVTEGQTEKRYDAYGSYLGQGEVTLYSYEYGFYDDGTLRYSIASDAATEDYRSSMAYDEHGNRVRVEHEDGTATTLRNEYDGERLVKQESYAQDGTMLDRTTFDYDEQGRLKRMSFLTPGASATITTTYSYGLVYLPGAES
ncbi:MAG: hypothetical protein IJV41_00850 [Oscillospiraceae bacterium]|nr:hypothetical protein [Oscillospiraceae bacterium]